MYVPPLFNDSNPQEVKEFIDNNGFGILVSQHDKRPWATHIPMELIENDNDEAKLIGHISRGNRQWKSFKEQDSVMAIFQGPHAYVSSSWYNHENVPTWNYVAVHIYGSIRIIEGPTLVDSLKRLIEKYENSVNSEMRYSDLSEKMLNRELKGIVGFEIAIEEVKAAYKMSQNRDNESYQNVISHLSKPE